MRSSIRWRLVLMFMMLVVIVMMISGSMIVLMVRNYQMDALGREIISIAEDVHNDLTLDEVPTVDQLNTRMKTIFVNGTQSDLSNKKVFIVDTSRKVVYPKTSEGLPMTSFQVHAALNEGVLPEFDVRTDIDENGYKYIGYAKGIKDEDGVVYVVYVVAHTNNINNMTNSIISIILLSVAAALIISMVLGFVFSDFLTKPITALSIKARDMQRGQLDRPMKVYANDEIGQLTKNFNKMAHSLNETLNQVTSEKNKLEIVFKHMTDGILVFDKIGMMIHSNPASIQMLGIEKQISFQEVFKPYLDISYSELKENVKDETLSHIVLVKDKYYSVYFAKFLDQYNVAVGIICVIQDITEHKKLEEMQKEFVANVSHELRTPLTTIKSYAETLLEGALDDRDTSERFLTVINHEGDRMTALVQDLLELSKLDNSQVKFSMNDINLEQILAESTEKYKIHSEKKQQSLIYYPPGFECRIIGDANRIEQVLKNIISNAVKYSQEGALIEVGLKDTSRYFNVYVKDNGMGISKEDLTRIFDRFYRVDKARSREMGGTGLGLAIAKEIMEFHGGKIEVTSDIGKGTTFELYFQKKLGNSY